MSKMCLGVDESGAVLWSVLVARAAIGVLYVVTGLNKAIYPAGMRTVSMLPLSTSVFAVRKML